MACRPGQEYDVVTQARLLYSLVLSRAIYGCQVWEPTVAFTQAVDKILYRSLKMFLHEPTLASRVSVLSEFKRHQFALTCLEFRFRFLGKLLGSRRGSTLFKLVAQQLEWTYARDARVRDLCASISSHNRPTLTTLLPPNGGFVDVQLPKYLWSQCVFSTLKAYETSWSVFLQHTRKADWLKYSKRVSHRVFNAYRLRDFQRSHSLNVLYPELSLSEGMEGYVRTFSHDRYMARAFFRLRTGQLGLASHRNSVVLPPRYWCVPVVSRPESLPGHLSHVFPRASDEELADPATRRLVQTHSFCEWCRATTGRFVLDDTVHFVCHCPQFDDLRVRMREELRFQCRTLFQSPVVHRCDSLIDQLPTLSPSRQVVILLCGARVVAGIIGVRIRPQCDFVLRGFGEAFLWPAMRRYLRSRLEARERAADFADVLRRWRGQSSP
jgi:hypothetical protein